MYDRLNQWLAELVRLQENDRMTERQLNILRAAVAVFAEKGFAAASTSEIAQRAGVAEGTIFRHYKTKKELLLSIVEPVIDEFVGPFLLQDLEPILADPHERYEDFLRAILRNRLQFGEKYAPILRILLQEIPFHPELQARMKHYVTENVVQRFLQIIRYFQEKGDIARMSPYTAIRLTASVIVGHVFARHILLPDAPWDDESEIELTVRFVASGMRLEPPGS
jgi:AcrR family transcriptional regulator